MTTVLESLNSALHNALATDDRVIILGEDILDPYGGTFKVTRGLSTQFPQRLLTTPISEAGIVGVATGMALRGLRPVVEIMFGDFVTLITDQVINHLAKFRWMYNDQVRVPLVIRTPMGGRRGYGPTHSQSLEKLFLGVPGLRVVAVSALGDPGQLLQHAIQDEDPVLFVENKLLYALPMHTPESLTEFELQTEATSRYPFYKLHLKDAPPPGLTIAAYGHMAELAREAILRLAYEEERFAELIVLTQLSPFQLEGIIPSCRRTHRLLVIEEGTLTLGWGAEVVARVKETLGPNLHTAHRLAARDLPIPASRPLEETLLPGVEDIFHIAKEMV
jgi:pyruvate/2-oxoglutarate/acetoin dehydrogenase E1 component